MIQIKAVDDDNQRLVVRRLFGEYQRDVERMIAGTDACPWFNDIDDELVQLATIYGSPGTLLLASNQRDERLGCVGFKSIGQINGQRTGEMRRLFVREQYRTVGAGQALAERLVSHARENGFSRIVLNTLPEMTSAHSLYSRLGFTPSEPHVEEPAEGTLYFSLDLT